MDESPHRKVWRAHLASLNSCRLIDGGTFKVNLHAPGHGRITTQKSLAGAFGIPELMPPNRRRIFKVNLHAPGHGRTTNYESLAGTFGIPESMPPIGGGLLK